MHGRKPFRRGGKPAGDTGPVLVHVLPRVLRAETDIEAAIDAFGNAAGTREEAVARRLSGAFGQKRAFDGGGERLVLHGLSAGLVYGPPGKDFGQAFGVQIGPDVVRPWPMCQSG